MRRVGEARQGSKMLDDTLYDGECQCDDNAHVYQYTGELVVVIREESVCRGCWGKVFADGARADSAMLRIAGEIYCTDAATLS